MQDSLQAGKKSVTGASVLTLIAEALTCVASRPFRNTSSEKQPIKTSIPAFDIPKNTLLTGDSAFYKVGSIQLANQKIM